MENIAYFDIGGYGKVPDIPGAAPRRVELANRTPQVSSAKTVKIRYGPYKVPNMSKKSIMGESGTLFNYPDVKIDRPFAGGDFSMFNIAHRFLLANQDSFST